VRRSTLPPETRVLASVWAMRRKRDLSTGKVVKWKARLNIDGSKQQAGIDYDQTYAPVASWVSVRLILILATLQGWMTKQLDFVQAYPQAPVEQDIYIDVPKWCNIGFEDTSKWALQVLRNIYGQKQAGKVWHDYLIERLSNELQFTQSTMDPCILWRGQVILIIYTDDTIITRPNEKDINTAIADISSKFSIPSKDSVSDFLGVHIERRNNNIIEMTQPTLIQSILDDLELKEDSNTTQLPALSTRILHAHHDSEAHAEIWHYRSLIGKLNFLAQSTRPDISYAVHQCARFTANPKREHSKAVKTIGRYLAGTKNLGLTCTINASGSECFSDAHFAGNWNVHEAEYDDSTARSRTGYVIRFAGCPLIWGSRLQTEIALSSTESGYISLSQSLRDVIYIIDLIKELQTAGFDFGNLPPIVHCKAFEDNNGALKMATVQKLRPRTKHINVKYHHFRRAVLHGIITLHQISTQDQIADIFTKPLSIIPFTKLRKLLMG
jgi:Reverse transcriptase (RNA-dependent DNA polymerase)